VSCEAPVVSGNAAVACQLIRVTASIATGVWHTASVHSLGACVALGFARVARGVVGCAVVFVTFVSSEASFVSYEVAVVSCEAAVVSCEATVVS
jgi:hypothetical protein